MKAKDLLEERYGRSNEDIPYREFCVSKKIEKQ